MQGRDPTPLDAALWYAKRGWAVLPLHTPRDGVCSCSLGAQCGRNAGKHPRTQRGHIDATTDRETIKAWWKRWPNANVGIRTGTASGILVLDIDPRNEGDVTLERYVEQFGDLPAAPKVATGGNGTHFYFKFESGTRSTAIQGGIDIKGDGGFVVAPPSVHASGGIYRWAFTPQKTLPEPPDWLIKEQRAKHREPALPQRKLAEGERHNYLVRAAGYYRRAGNSADFIYQALMDLNVQWCEPPLPSDEINKIAYSTEEWQGGPALILTPEFNDAGNRDMLVAYEGQNLRWTNTHGDCVWLGGKWDLRDTLKIMQEMALRTARRLRDLPIEFSDDPEEATKQRDRWQKWIVECGNDRRIQSMMRLMRSHPQIAMRFEDFDRDPWVFNVFNGTVDLRSGKLLPHRREDYISKQAPVWYDPKAKCPTFEAHIDLVTDGNANLAEYLQRLFGYCLTGNVTESVFPIFWGEGSNGKSTLLRAVSNVMGMDYAMPAPESFLVSRRREEHPTEVAGLAGARLVVASETDKSSRLNVSQMKQLTGEDKITSRYMRMDYFTFPITFKIIYQTNHKPIVTNTEIATWRRIKLVPFTAEITNKQRDPLIDEKLRAEASGILNWLLRGCRMWQYDGLREPKEIRIATSQYRSDSDAVHDFISNFLEFGEDFKVSASSMHTAYNNWAMQEGAKTYGKRQLNSVLRSRPEFRGINPPASSNGSRVWRGVGLRFK